MFRHQLPDNPPEEAVPRHLPAVGRVVLNNYPVANRLGPNRRPPLWLPHGRLADENVRNLPEDQLLIIINDLGRQVRAEPIQLLCKVYGIQYLFCRPRTRYDNPLIELTFSTAIRDPEYPGRLLDDREAVTYFTRCFTWDDTENYHAGLHSVTT